MKPLNFLALLLFLAGVVWVFTLSEEAVRQVQKVYYTAVSPIVAKGGKAENFARSFVEEVEHSSDLAKKLEQAERERDSFRIIAFRAQTLQEENNELRKALEFRQRSPFDVIPARVIRKQPRMWGRTLGINRGSDHGVGVSLCVLASNGGLVGRIQLPGKELSSVLLATDEGSQVSARVDGTSEVGLVVGRRTNYGEAPRLRLRYLSKNAFVRKGAKVFTDGRGNLFPANILIGTIEDFESGPVYGEAEVIPAVDFTNLQTVFVITNMPGEQ